MLSLFSVGVYRVRGCINVPEQVAAVMEVLSAGWIGVARVNIRVYLLVLFEVIEI